MSWDVLRESCAMGVGLVRFLLQDPVALLKMTMISGNYTDKRFSVALMQPLNGKGMFI